MVKVWASERMGPAFAGHGLTCQDSRADVILVLLFAQLGCHSRFPQHGRTTGRGQRPIQCKESILTIQDKQTQSRRTFFNELAHKIGRGGMAAVVLRRVGFAAQDNRQGILANINLSEHKELEKVGGFVLVKDTSAGNVLIVRSGDNQLSALSPICPHKQCQVEVKGPTMIQCPCHKSTYKLDGTYERGPAKASLKKFNISKEGDVLTVRQSLKVAG
jgi:Rieske Fe-S protein